MLSRRALIGGAALIAASPTGGARGQGGARPVVASFSILDDFVHNVGGDRVDLSTIVGSNGDAHVYAPTPEDARKLSAARLIFVNGLGFEGWIDRLIASSKTGAVVVTVSKGISPRTTEGGVDPHAWLDVLNARAYVENIRDALGAADEDGAPFYRANAARYLLALSRLDDDMQDDFSSLPLERRRVVSTHDAFGYFSTRYGVEFIAPQGVSTESEPSARDVARIIDAVKRRQVHAVFLENIGDPRLMRRIAAETGARIGGTLYSDALSDTAGPAATYIDLMRHNVRELVKALAP
jgi:zinc/manganese transport system substrate-binding protein